VSGTQITLQYVSREHEGCFCTNNVYLFNTFPHNLRFSISISEQCKMMHDILSAATDP